MRSSRAFAVSSLDLPAVTAADRVSGVLVALATAFVAWACVREGVDAWQVAFAVLAGGLGCATLALAWGRARTTPARRLEALPDGSLWLHQAGQAAVRLTVGRGTRLLGPSVFLDLHAAYPGSPDRLRCWISPLDAPADVVRQWSVVLPRCGRVACT